MFLKVGKLLVTIHARLPWPRPEVNHGLVSHKMILLGENLEADVAHIIGRCFHVVSFYLVRLEVMELLVAYLTHLLPTAGLEDLVDDPQMLVEVGNLLATLGAVVSLPLMHHFNVSIMV